MRRPTVDLFTGQTVQVSTPCLVWTGGTTGTGEYGTFTHRVGDEVRTQLAHRWAYEHFIGPIPEGMTVDHLCMVTRCVNTEHMELVTLAENLRRRHAKKTHCKRGHEWTEENTKPIKGGRTCRLCIAVRAEQYRARRQAVAS